MTSRTLRRRLHHGDVDGKTHEHLETTELDGLNEPLLGNDRYDNRHSEVRTYFTFPSPMIHGGQNVVKTCCGFHFEYSRGVYLKIFGMMSAKRNSCIGHCYFLN